LILGNRSIAHLKSGNVKSALEDAELAVSLRPDWAKGHLRRGNALKTLRRHEEAFKALFSCLVLEKSALSKPVKQELAKELHQLLRIANECESEQPNFYLKQREKNSIRLFDEHEIDDLER
jgi:tetratricopeptide (TPR) repeat protein